jgi:hypothetical protein
MKSKWTMAIALALISAGLLFAVTKLSIPVDADALKQAETAARDAQKQGNSAAALRAYRRWLEFFPNEPAVQAGIYRAMSLAAEESGETDQAKVWIGVSAQLDPDFEKRMAAGGDETRGAADKAAAVITTVAAAAQTFQQLRAAFQKQPQVPPPPQQAVYFPPQPVGTPGAAPQPIPQPMPGYGPQPVPQPVPQPIPIDANGNPIPQPIPQPAPVDANGNPIPQPVPQPVQQPMPQPVPQPVPQPMQPAPQPMPQPVPQAQVLPQPYQQQPPPQQYQQQPPPQQYQQQQPPPQQYQQPPQQQYQQQPQPAQQYQQQQPQQQYQQRQQYQAQYQQPRQNAYAAPQSYARPQRRTRGDEAKPIRVFHDHSRLGDAAYFEQPCGALLLVEAGNLTFTASGGEGSLVIPASDIIEIRMNTAVGREAGAFHIITRKGLYLHLAPESAKPEDGRADVDELRKQLGIDQ